MKKTLLTTLTAAAILLSTSNHAFAQADTAQAREVFAEVNARLGSLTKTSLIAKRPDVEYKSEVTGWRDAKGVRKIETIDRDDSGDVITEYYYRDGALVFVYQAIKGFNNAGKQVTRLEERQYFSGGKMFKWLSGLEKAANPPGTPDFNATGKERLAASAFFLRELSKPSAGMAKAAAPVPTTPASAAATVKVGKFTKQTSGVLKDLVNGDIACYLSLKGDDGKPFEEMGDFSICEKQMKLIGKRVALSYALQTVMSDECQGDENCKKTKTVALVMKVSEVKK